MIKTLKIGTNEIRGLPPVTVADNEKVLGVVDGKWQVVEPETFEVTEKSWTRTLNFGGEDTYGVLPSMAPAGKVWERSNVTEGSFYCIVYGDGLWVAGSYDDAGLYYSTDSKTWTQSNITSGDFSCIVYANGMWVAGGINGNTGLYYSTDGKTWMRNNNIAEEFRCIIYSNGLWVAISNYGAYHSIDGMIWETHGYTTDEIFQSIAYDNNLWVAGSAINTGLYYSTDNETWTQSNITSGYFFCVACANDIWVACRRDDGGLYYSTDGKTWTQSNITSGIFFCAAYANGIWAACGGNGFYYSTDGKSWIQSNITSGMFYCMAYGDDIWIASGYEQGFYYSQTSDNSKILTVVDGEWAAAEPPSLLKIVSWADGTDEEICAMVAAADAGKINLADYWSVGDERTVSLAAMDATGVGESHVAQDVTFVLMNQGGKTLVEATESGRTECSFIVGLKNCLTETGYMNSSNTNSGSWNSSARRTWCNSIFRNAIPSTLREIFKQHKNLTIAAYNGSSNQETADYFALPAEKEIFGSATSSNSVEANALSQFTYYATASNRVKKLGNSGSVCGWWERSPYSSLRSGFCDVSSGGSASISSASSAFGVAPFGVI